MKNRILIADDDKEIREVLGLILKGEGFHILEASHGEEVLELLDDSIDLVILDIMMPGMNGFTTCVEIRKKSAVPILFLTAKTLDSDKSFGFSVGADDYLVKPFSCVELLSRIKALLRRYCVYGARQDAAEEKSVSFGNVEIDRAACVIRVNGEEVFFTDIEYRILMLLASNRRKIFSIENIYQSVWNEPYFYSVNNTVMVHVSNIRRKIGDADAKLIKTVWGRGYRIE